MKGLKTIFRKASRPRLHNNTSSSGAPGSTQDTDSGDRKVIREKSSNIEPPVPPLPRYSASNSTNTAAQSGTVQPTFAINDVPVPDPEVGDGTQVVQRLMPLAVTSDVQSQISSAPATPVSPRARRASRVSQSANTAALNAIVQSGVQVWKENDVDMAVDLGRQVGRAVAPIAAAVTQTMQNIEGCIQLLDDHLPHLVKILDDVSKIHPAAAAAFYIVKTVFELYMARRENDRRIQTLYLQMSEIGAILGELRYIKVLSQVLQVKVTQVADDMQECAKTCDAYSKTGAVVKFLRAGIWADQLTAFAQQFKDRRAQVQEALAIHSAKKLERMHESILKHIDFRMEDIATIFQTKFLTDKEKALQSELKNLKPGPDHDVDLMLKKLLQKELEQDAKSSGRSAKVTDQKLEALKADLLEDTATTIEKNGEEFKLKFDAALKKQTEQLKQAMEENSDKLFGKLTGVLARNQRRVEQVTSTLLRGQRRIEQVTNSMSIPYEKIQNPTLRDVWKRMNWAGHAEARQFVMAVRDYFNENLDEARKATNSSNSTTKVDGWALAYIGPKWQQRIMEAIDEDASGYVTIAELNKFTEALPASLEWSLPRWLAYWAIGWQMTATVYLTKIRSVLANMLDIIPHMLPRNRNFVDEYFDIVYRTLLPFLASLETCSVPSALLQRFQGYMDLEEKRIEQNLEEVRYNVDATDTLRVNIVGSGRIEKYIFPLVYLLLRNHLGLLRAGRNSGLDKDMLQGCADSISTCMDALNLRMSDLADYFRAQESNVDVDTRFESTACGVFKYFNQDGNLWKISTIHEFSLDSRDRSYPSEGDTDEVVPKISIAPAAGAEASEDSEDASSCGDVLPRHNAWCDVCGNGIVGERYTCLECWNTDEKIWLSMDFCSELACLEWRGESASGLLHSSTHRSIIKLRGYVHMNDSPSLYQRAKDALEYCAERFNTNLEHDIENIELAVKASNDGAQEAMNDGTIPPEGQGSSADRQGLDSNTQPGNPLQSHQAPDDAGSVVQTACCTVCRKTLSPPCWCCLECSTWNRVYFICDDCEEHTLLSCQSCAQPYVQPTWYFGFEDDDRFLCQKCTSEGSSIPEDASGRHVYIHPLVRYHHTDSSVTAVDDTASVAHVDDQLGAVHKEVTVLHNNMKVVQDTMDVVHTKIGSIQDAVRAQIAPGPGAERVGVIDTKLETLQSQMDRIEKYLARMMATADVPSVESGAGRGAS
ncbi:hypothetical protein OBBRIDRAFT_840073 [Obba rivulosa]|uniref:EF-hand domain-containing protein n=1 Tax=Obba rivulosa TaxID=1052685 RepID=A0A8E2AGC3_9APHY|nr:hypothetical protein OBBRIDRAFT_840073 [Obba rivulosa]